MSGASYFLSLLVLAWSWCARPSSARCPGAWSLGTGVQPGGYFYCWAPESDADQAPAMFLISRVYCRRTGERATTDDGRTVTCTKVL